MNKEYDVVNKIILKNIMINPNLGAITLNPNVVSQLEQHFRKKFEQEQQNVVDFDDKVWEPFKDF